MNYYTAPSGSSGGGPPSGAAGGDLSGTYPNPTVAKLNGVAAASYPTYAASFNITNLAGSGITNATIPNLAAQNSTTSGNVDVYTVPTGRRLWWASYSRVNPSGVTTYPEVKISGVYYRVGLSVTTNGVSRVGIILEAGQTVAFNADSATTFNWYGAGIEFDNTASIKSSIVTGLTTGDNIIYTAPGGKNAILLNSDGVIPNATNAICAWIGSVTSPGLISLHNVASGGSSASTNAIEGAISLGANSLGQRTGVTNLLATREIVLSVASGQTDAIAWVVVAEV